MKESDPPIVLRCPHIPFAPGYNHPDMDPDQIFSGFSGAVTVCDTEGILIYMNPAAEAQFSGSGGRALLGSNLFDCHPKEAQEIIKALMRDRKSNVYTIEKSGKKHLIYQSPWYQDGEYAGLMEISFEIPIAIPNFQRK